MSQICVFRGIVAQTYHKRCYFSGWDLEGEIIENPCIWPGGVAEGDVIDVDHAAGDLRSDA